MNSYKAQTLKHFMGISLMTAAIMAATPALASYPEGYYDSLNGKCGVELMHAVRAVAKDHKVISYGNDTWEAFRSTDIININGTDYWWDMYSDEKVKVGSSKPDNKIMNIEHSVAQSWWKGSSDSPRKNDIVHLNPSNSNANNRKSNYPLSEIDDVTWENGVTFVGHPKSGQGGGNNYVYEPCDEYKGDFARAFMYMFTIYSDLNWNSACDWMFDTSKPLMFKDWARNLLLKWHAADQVSDKELKRNDGIYKEQHNRNPFIDLPALADHIWGSKANEPFKVDDNYVPDPNPNPNPTDPTTINKYLWLSENDSDMGEWEVDDRTLPSAGKFVWQWKEYQGLHYLNASAHINGTPYEALSYIWSPIVSMKDVSSAKLTFDHAAKFQTNCKELCKLVVMNHDVNANAPEYIKEYSINTWQSPGKWTFTTSEEFDLSEYTGHNISVGFKYESTPTGADTWEIRNVRLDLVRDQSGVNSLPQEFDDSDLVEVWGNNILAPEGARIFDLNGREVNGENLTPGLYIVTKQSFQKAIKVLVK